MKENFLSHTFGADFSDKLSKKLNKAMLFPEVHPYQQKKWHLQDCFHPNSTPVERDPDVIYPVYAPYYLQQLIPSSFLEIMPGYSRTAALAAIQWLQKTLPACTVDLHHFHGECFTADVDGKDYRFCFPRLAVSYMPTINGTATRTRLAAVLPFPDTRDNDSYWDKRTIPSFAESQARTLLWCWRYVEETLGRHTEVPVDCYIVRITGNTPGDVTIRTVHTDVAKEDILISRLCKSFDRERKQGLDPVNAPKIRHQDPWYVSKEQEEADANYIEDPAFYNQVQKYMMLLSHKKTCEAKSQEIKAEMDAIAVKLASMTSVNAAKGIVEDPAAKFYGYSVIHNRTNRKPASIGVGLVRQFFPEYLDCVVTNEKARGRITIDAAE